VGKKKKKTKKPKGEISPKDITITFIKNDDDLQNDDDLFDLVSLKQADDSEFMGIPIPEEEALGKILGLRNYGSDLWIVRQGLQAVGYAVGKLDRESNYRSTGIYVTPEYRNQGIGSALKQAQIGFARELGCKEIWSNIVQPNEASNKVHEKMGFTFKPVGEDYIVRLQLRMKGYER